jgi:DNA-binding MarR family transcriptional regulator
MVALVDALERRTLVERRARTGDRRAFALFLTREGRQLLGKITEVSDSHEAELCAGLTPAERRRLIALLSRLVAEQHLPVGVHPGVGENWAGRGKRGVRARRPRE